ncbi:MAG: hypothetical protein V1688_03500 [bacterium]
MKNIYKIIIISLCVYLSLAANCAKANVDCSKDFSSSLNNENFLLVKTNDSPAVYFIINNKRHKILNSEVFLDYCFNWDNVETITYKQLEKYPPAKTVKTAGSPKIYYVNEALNKKKPIPNEAIFLAYENKWKDIFIISQKDLDSYPDINLIKSANSSKIYELKDGVKKPIADQQELISNGYKWNEVVIVKDVELNYYPTKAAAGNEEVIDVEIKQNENKEEQNNDIAPQIVPSDRHLSVKTIKQNKDILAPSGSIVPMLNLKLTAGLGKPVNVDFIKISRVKGFSSIEKIIVSDENKNVLGSAEMLDKNYADIKLKPELYIAPGASKIININGSTKNDDHIVYEQLFIESINDISTDADITGSFPLTGDRIKVVPGKNLIGEIEVGAVVVSGGSRNAYLGETDSLITKFVLSETTGNEDVYFKRLKITNTGSSYVKLANVDLVDQDNHVIATVKEPSGNIIVFDMAQSPYKIPKGLSRTFSIRADIIDGPGGNIKFEIKQANDILATGKEYLFDLMVSNKQGSSFSIGRNVNTVKINNVDVAVYKSDLSSVGGLVAGSEEKSLGIFNIRVNGSTINYKTITLQIINEHGKVNLKGDLIIRDYKTKKAIGQVQAASASNAPAIVELDAYPKIDAKQTFAFEVLANVDGDATILDTYQLRITRIGFQTLGNDSDLDLDCKVDGNILSVKKSNLIINSNGALKDAKISAGKTKVLVGGFILQAGVAEDLTINSFNISEAAGYGAISYGEGYSNLKIRVNGKDYAVFPAPAGGQFISNKPFAIAAGKSVSVEVYVDTTSLVDGDKIKLAINNVNAYGKISGLEPSQTGSNSQSLTVEFQQSKLIIKPNTEMGDTVINAGVKNQKIASFSFENKGVENVAIKNFTLAEAEGSDEISYSNGYSNLKTTGNHVVKKPIAGGNVFSNFTIKAGATVIIDVYIDADASTFNHQIKHFNLVFKDIQVAGGIVVEGDYVVGQGVRVVGN